MGEQEELVLPIEQYDALLELIEDESQEIVHAIGLVTTEKEDVARTLARIFEARGKAHIFLNTALDREIKATGPSPSFPPFFLPSC
jgi:hypothetical protein